MSRRGWCVLGAVLVSLIPGQARAADPSASIAQSEWLFGVEGLVRTPVDFSLNFGGSWFDYGLNGEVTHIENPTLAPTSNGDFDIDPAALQGGFRFSGGIGFWQCCVLIEPALAFWIHGPLGSGRTDNGPIVGDPDDQDEFSTSEIELEQGWDLAFGPQFTWRIDEDLPGVGGYLGGLPLVFFPYLGISHAAFDADLTVIDPTSTPPVASFVREFQDTLLMVGFDLDIPLPGAHGPFTHALTFGFKWVDGGNNHSFLQRFPGNSELRRYEFEGLDGPRYELRYTVYWNDFEGFFKRNFFGPAS